MKFFNQFIKLKNGGGWNPPYVKKIISKINIQTVNILFVVSLGAIFISYILFATGLRYDGSNNLYSIIAGNSFTFFEKSRIFFHILYQTPAVIFVKFSNLSSLSLLTRVFSFGLISLHIFSFLICYFILPKNKKNFIFFPLFGFFIGPAVSLQLSISVALSVCSYIWMMAFIIYYSDLSNKMHRFLWFIALLPLVLSHEMMIYMAWPLIFLCWNKLQKGRKKDLTHKVLILFTIFFLFVTSFLQLYLMLFHSFLFEKAVPDLISIYTTKPEIPLMPALIALAGVFFFFMKHPLNEQLLKIQGVVSFFMFFYLFITVLFFSLKNELLLDYKDLYNLRLYPPTAGLIFSLLFWWFYENKQMDISKISKTFLFSCVCCCLSLLSFRLHFDYMFYNRRSFFVKKLSECSGLLTWEAYTKDMPFEKWKGFYRSLIFPESKNIKAIVLNNSYSECRKSCLYLKEIQTNKPVWSEFSISFRKNLTHNQQKWCFYRCERDFTVKKNLQALKRANQSRFFNTNKAIENISNNISYCEDDKK